MNPRSSNRVTRTAVVAPIDEILMHIRSGEFKTRTDIAEYYDIALSTVTIRIKELLRRELISEISGPSQGGRPIQLLMANSDDLGIIVVDLTPEQPRMAIMTLDNALHREVPLEVSRMEGPDKTINAIIRAYQTQDWGLRAKAMAIIVPGPVNTDIGQLMSPANLPDWHGYPFLDEVRARVDIPVLIENDANCMAFAHSRVGGNGQTRTSVSVYLDYGLGAGLMHQGDIFRGANGLAGDFAHTTIEHQPVQYCSCGKRNCLDTLASGRAIVRELQAIHPEVHTLNEALEMATSGDKDAIELCIRAADQVGSAIALMINMLNPAVVYLTGRLCEVEPFAATLKTVIYDRSYPGTNQFLRLLVRQEPLDMYQGAALLCIETLIPELDIQGLLSQ